MPNHAKPDAAAHGLPLIALGALGVVFGDIGTSPLYALQICFQGDPAFAHDPAAVIGVLSLIVWSVILVVCVKYTGFILRADHDGEGGTLALLGLIRTKIPPLPFGRPGALTLMVLFGSALLYGDGIVTPAISVLSAVEGLKIASPGFQTYVVPLAVVILVALFLVQHLGTEKVGRFFGPVMLLWFVAIALVGIVGTVQHPAVLAAFNPVAGLRLLVGHGWAGYAVLGAVVLCFSGTEALFADLGHFGRRPIVLAWYVVVLPAVALNYLGQGALLLQDPGAAANPFFAIVPHWALYPAGRVGDGGHGHRLAGADLGRVLPDAAGDQHGVRAALRRGPHVGGGAGPDLHARRQLRADGRLPGIGAGLPIVGGAWRGLWAGGDRHHDHHVDDVLRRDPPGVGMVHRARRAAGRWHS